MKKYVLVSFLALIVIFVHQNAFAKKKPFSGIITYKIILDDSGMDEMVKSQMPKTLKVYVLGNKTKREMVTPMGMTYTITDGDTKTVHLLMNMFGSKFAVKSGMEDIEKDYADYENTGMEITDETKEVAGYQCKKAIVKIMEKGKSEADEYAVWFSEELGNKELNNTSPLFSDIDGLMLEFEMLVRGMSMKLIAEKVEKKKVKAKEFDIPEDYEILTPEQMKEKFGGM